MVGHKIFSSWMDLAAPENEKKTALYTPIGVYCYTVMPFRLKSVGSMYQRAMKHIFSYMIHEEMKYYVNDIIVKWQTRKRHLPILLKVLPRCRSKT